MALRCKPGDLVIVEAESGMEPCASEHRGLTFVVREQCDAVVPVMGVLVALLPAWYVPEALPCKHCGHRRAHLLDADLRPLRSDGATPKADPIDVNEVAHA